MIARTAAKDLTNPDVLEMEDVRSDDDDAGRPQRRRHGTGRILRRQGRNAPAAETMSSSAPPNTRSCCSEALLNVRAGTVVSEQPVVVNMLQGTINANRIEVGGVGRGHPVRGWRDAGDRSRGQDAPQASPREHPGAVDDTTRPPSSAGLPGRRGDRRRAGGGREPGRRASRQAIARPVQGAMPQKRDEPVKITSATLEVRDKSQDGDLQRRRARHPGRNRRALQCARGLLRRRRRPAQASRVRRKRRRRRRSGGRQPADPAHGGEGLRHRDPEGSAGGRRPCRIRHAHQHRHADRKRGRDEGRRRGARPADGGRFDHRRIAGGIRRRPGRGHVPIESPQPKMPGKQN